MRGIKHPMTDEIYEVSDDGLNVVVTSDAVDLWRVEGSRCSSMWMVGKRTRRESIPRRRK